MREPDVSAQKSPKVWRCMMDCILKRCAHHEDSKPGRPCRSLEECGAAYALDRSRDPGGYEVIDGNNPTIDALKRAGLVTMTRCSERTSIATAVQSIKSRKAS